MRLSGRIWVYQSLPAVGVGALVAERSPFANKELTVSGPAPYPRQAGKLAAPATQMCLRRLTPDGIAIPIWAVGGD